MPCIECGDEFEHGLHDGQQRLNEVIEHYVAEHGLDE